MANYNKDIFEKAKVTNLRPILRFVQTVQLVITLFLLPGEATATSKVSAMSGGWENPATWTPAGVPLAGDNVIISSNHTVSVNNNQQIHQVTVGNGGTLNLVLGKRLTMSGNLSVNGTMNMNKGEFTFTSPGLLFSIGNTGSFTWDPGMNTYAEATLFTNGVENFDPQSTLIIKRWYNYTVPIGAVVSGNFGNLEINSPGGTNSIVEWDQKNLFSIHQVLGTLTIDQGWITLDKTGSIKNMSIGALVLRNVNSVFFGHYGTHHSCFTLTFGSLTNNGGTFYGLSDGNGNIICHITGDVFTTGNIKLINNSGVPGVCNGNATFIVDGTFRQVSGDTRILYNLATKNSGIFTATFGNLNVNGGIFMGQSACHTANGNCSIHVVHDLNINLPLASNKFRGTSLSSISSTVNNTGFTLLVGGNFNISGNPSAEFTSSASSGPESVNIKGNISITGVTCNFNYGDLAASHNSSFISGGDFSLNGGSCYFSRNNGNLQALIGGNMSVAGGTMALKNSSGAANFTVGKNFIQSGGTIYFHNNTGIVSSDQLNFFVNANFSQAGGTLNFDDNGFSTGTNTLHLGGDSVLFSGNGNITRATTGNSPVLGNISYEKAGTMIYSRQGNAQFIDQAVQTIANGCKVSIANGPFQLASFSQSGINFLNCRPGSTLQLNNAQIISNAHYSFSGIYADSASVISLSRTQGWYDGSPSAALCSNGNMNYELNPSSTIEYCGTATQAVTGVTGTTPPAVKKYGVLRINMQGATAKLISAGTFVRTRLELFNGALLLNNFTLTIENGSGNAMHRINGYVVSEGTASFNNSIITWKNITPGIHEFPFGINSTQYIPVTVTPLTGTGASVSVSTRPSLKDNTPYPQPQMNFPGVFFADEQVIDRWWWFSSNGVKANVSLSYAGTENTLTDIYATNNLSIIQWIGNHWNTTASSAPGIKSGIGTMTMNAATLSNDWTIASDSLQQAIALDANLRSDDVAVNWQIASDANTDYYIVERSDDGINFSEVGHVDATGNSSQVKNYNFTDPQLPLAEAFYRLKQVANNGSYKYSNKVKLNKDMQTLPSLRAVGPNPFTSELKLDIYSANDRIIHVTIRSMDGKIMFSKEIQSEKGEQSIVINELESLSAGNYILTLTGNGLNESKTIIKN